MRIRLHEIQDYAKTLLDLSELAAEFVNSSIALWMTANPDASIAECREYAKAAVSAAVGRYGDAAAVNASKLYDEVMDGEGVDVPYAAIYGGDEKVIDGTVRRQVEKLKGDSPDRDGFLEQVGKLASDQVRHAARNTIASNVRRDSKTRRGRRVRFARVPTRPDPCGYCVMLASRGFIYLSMESAEAANHHNCTCLFVPGIDGVTKVDGYDPDGMYDRYKACRGTIAHDLATEKDRLLAAGAYDADAFNEWCKNRIVDEMNTRHRAWLKDGLDATPQWTAEDGARPNPAEKETARRLRENGIIVRFRKTRENEDGGKRTSDVFFHDGNNWEFKQPKGSGKRNIGNQFNYAMGQSDRLVIDASESPFGFEGVCERAQSELDARDDFIEVLVIDDENMRRLKKSPPGLPSKTGGSLTD